MHLSALWYHLNRFLLPHHSFTCFEANAVEQHITVNRWSNFISFWKVSFFIVSLPEPPLSKWFVQTEITGERLNKNFPCLSPSERHMDLQAQTLNKYIKYQNTVHKLFFPPLGRNQHQNRRIMSELGCEETQSLY